jgi:hypothetical protein
MGHISVDLVSLKKKKKRRKAPVWPLELIGESYLFLVISNSHISVQLKVIGIKIMYYSKPIIHSVVLVSSIYKPSFALIAVTAFAEYKAARGLI